MTVDQLVPLEEVLAQHALERKLENLKLVAQALEFLAELLEKSIPGEPLMLTSAQQVELKQIILALPLAVAV